MQPFEYVDILQIAILIGLLIIVWGYGGYILPIIFSKSSKNSTAEVSFQSITVVIPAFNEANILAEKIRNTLQLKYPKELLNILVVTDGSSDSSAEVAGDFEGVTVIHDPERRGKSMAINRAMKFVKTEWVAFTDANTMLSELTLEKTAKWLSQNKCGGVSGEKKVLNTGADRAASEGEGLYWKYECFLKQVDSDFYSLIGAPGEFFAMRSNLFHPLESDTILDDFMLAMRLCEQGWVVKYDKEIVASENPSATTADELKRKIRISAGGFQAITRLKKSLNPFDNFKLAYLYWSHRIIRWCIAPTLLIVVFITPFFVSETHWFFEFLCYAQVLFYGMAVLGYFAKLVGVKIKGLYVPFYFVMMNFAAVAGFFRFLGKKQNAAWEKVNRA